MESLIAQRIFNRIKANSSIVVAVVSAPEEPQYNKMKMFARLNDVSINGLSFVTQERVPTSSRIKVFVQIGDGPTLMLVGDTRWSSLNKYTGEWTTGVLLDSSRHDTMTEWRNLFHNDTFVDNRPMFSTSPRDRRKPDAEGLPPNSL